MMLLADAYNDILSSSCATPSAMVFASVPASVPLFAKGPSAVAEGRCRTDKLDAVIKPKSSREATMVGRGASPRPSLSRRDRWFESCFLQRRVCELRCEGHLL